MSLKIEKGARGTFWKVCNKRGVSFYPEKIRDRLNYRKHVGKRIFPQHKLNFLIMCGPGCLHASMHLGDAISFAYNGAENCTFFRVRGTPGVVDNYGRKYGFRSLFVVKEYTYKEALALEGRLKAKRSL